MVSKELLAQQISNCVETLRKNDCGCCTIKLEGIVALCIGWSAGYDPKDRKDIHAKEDPTYVIVAGLKIWTSDSLLTDYDFISFPWLPSGEVLDCELPINHRQDYEYAASYFLENGAYLCNHEITEDGQFLGLKEEN